jgi:hypothetical protein
LVLVLDFFVFAGELAAAERGFRQATETVYRVLREIGQSYEEADRFIPESLQEARRRDQHYREIEIICEGSTRLASQSQGLKFGPA